MERAFVAPGQVRDLQADGHHLEAQVGQRGLAPVEARGHERRRIERVCDLYIMHVYKG